jgi:hypothetical protein
VIDASYARKHNIVTKLKDDTPFDPLFAYIKTLKQADIKALLTRHLRSGHAIQPPVSEQQIRAGLMKPSAKPDDHRIILPVVLKCLCDTLHWDVAYLVSANAAVPGSANVGAGSGDVAAVDAHAESDSDTSTTSTCSDTEADHYSSDVEESSA